MYCVLALLVFFFSGYLIALYYQKATLLIAAIFFFGAVFCFIMIRLVKNLTSTVKKRSIDIVSALVKVVEERDPNLNGHSIYVHNLVMLIWKHLPDSVRSSINPIDINYAAILHDIGKLGIPESILNKQGKLNDEEWAVMKEHPAKGVAILKQMAFFDKILPWIEYHHERMDGKGYYGIPAEKIPLESRIIAVADTYSAITMRRSYKPAKTYEEAIAIMKDAAGTQLDQDIVSLFCKIPRKEVEACAPDNVEVR